MRVAAAVIGGGGGALGAFVHALAIVAWAAMVLITSTSPAVLVAFAFIGTSAAAALLSAAGFVGAWQVLRGSARRGALLMLLAAVGLGIILAAQPFIVDAASDRSRPEGIGDVLEPSLAEPPLAHFVPAVALLAGAALAFVARRMGRNG